MKNTKIALPIYKILYSICFIVLLSVVRGISYISEIGISIDPNVSILAIVFCADVLECEYREKRWEVFSLLPQKSRMRTVRQRFLIEWMYLWMLAVLGYWLFYWQNPQEAGISPVYLYGIFCVAVGASIFFWGALSAAIVNLTHALFPGIGITILIWLCFNSKGGEKLLGNLNVFAFNFRDIMSVQDYGWVIGKVAAVGIALILLAKPSVMRRKG